MTVTWIGVALAAFTAAALLAAADGALLATGRGAPRSLVADPERAHRALSAARVLAHLVAGASIAAAAVSGMTLTVAALVTVPLLLAHVAAVEGIARPVAFARGDRAIARLAPVIFVADLMFAPVTSLGAAVEGALRRLLPPADDSLVRREQGTERFREVVAAEADVSAAEEELLHGVFTLGDTEVQEIMVPRVDVVGIDRSSPWSEVLDRVGSSEHARFPVFDETLDNVVGILYAKDLLPKVVSGDDVANWSALIRPATFIPATKTIDRQLRDFKAQRTHIAMVMDEYGGTAGVVTIEDILEEIVGEIRDEYDIEEAPVEQEGHERFWVSGRLSLTDLSELLGGDFEREGLTTVAGLVYDAFGRVPHPGESSRIDGFKVVVERVRRRRIERVYFEKTAAPPEGETS